MLFTVDRFYDSGRYYSLLIDFMIVLDVSYSTVDRFYDSGRC